MKPQLHEKRCENCFYFSQHYAKMYARYDTVCCGHCTNPNNKKMKPLGSCQWWQSIELKVEKRKKSINQTLELMAEQLNDIALILKDEYK